MTSLCTSPALRALVAALLSLATLSAAFSAQGGGGGNATQTTVALQATLALNNPSTELFACCDDSRVVAISANTAAARVTSYNPQTQVTTAQVYVYQRVGTAWLTQAVISAPDPAEAPNFGASLALEGDDLVIGVLNPEPGSIVGPNRTQLPAPNPAFVRGTYVFHRVGTSWLQSAHLVGSDAVADTYKYGAKVAISGNTILVSAPGGFRLAALGAPPAQPVVEYRHGAIYVFQNTAGVWAQAAKIVHGPQGVQDNFGSWGLTVSGDTFATGGFPAGASGLTNGAAWVYQRTAAGWAQQATLVANDQTPQAQVPLVTTIKGLMPWVGDGLALSADTLLVAGGDFKYVCCGGGVKGAAYVFQRVGATWSQQAKLQPKSSANNDGFGSRMAIDGELALFGYGGGSGSAYSRASLFVRKAGAWSETFMPSPGAAGGDTFGSAVGLDNTTLMIGQPGLHQYIYSATVAP